MTLSHCNAEQPENLLRCRFADDEVGGEEKTAGRGVRILHAPEQRLQRRPGNRFTWLPLGVGDTFRQLRIIDVAL